MDCSTLKPGDICIGKDSKKKKYLMVLSSFDSPRQYVFSGDANYIYVYDVEGNLLHTSHPTLMLRGGGDAKLLEKIPEKRVYEAWVNIYSCGDSVVLDSRREADEAASPERIACIHIKQEYTEGEGL